MLDLDVYFNATVHEGFDCWLHEGAEDNADVRASLDRANESVVPTARLQKVEGAYWCRIEREHLRWVLPDEEEALLDGMARVHAKRELHVGPGTKFAGAFRASGLVVPVWDLDPGAEADEIEDDAAALAEKLTAAMASTEPLSADERRARAGIVSRQLTLRSEEHTSELQSRGHLVCRLLLEKNNNTGYARWSRTPGTAASGARRSGRRTAATAASHTAQTAARPANVGSSGQHPPSPRSL